MKPYAKLRGKMAEMDINSQALANYLGKSSAYISDPFNPQIRLGYRRGI